jgi:hypothetical protein
MPSNVEQPLSAEFEFNAFIDYLNDHFKGAQPFDLARLQQELLTGYQKRSINEFERYPNFLDTWFISKINLARGDWTSAFTYAKANEGVAAHFGVKGIPKSSVTHFSGVGVAVWRDLLKKYKNNKYLKTRRTLNQYATESKKTILELKDLVSALKLNTGKLVRLSNGMSVYVGFILIDGKEHYAYSFINRLEVATWLSKFYGLLFY